MFINCSKKLNVQEFLKMAMVQIQKLNGKWERGFTAFLFDGNKIIP